MKNNTVISERIMKMIDFLSISKNDFANKLGYNRSQAIYDITSGKSKPSFDFFERLQNSEFSELFSLDWIVSGTGDMLKRNIKTMSSNERMTNLMTFSEKTKCAKNVALLEEPPPTYHKYSNAIPPLLDIEVKGTANVIVLPVKSAASDFTRALTDPVFVENNYETMSLPRLQYRKGPFFALEIEGDSMHPTLTHGEFIVGSPIIANEFIGGYIHTFYHNSMGLITKRVHWASKKEGLLLINSDNENIDDKEISINDVSPYFLKGICSINFNLRNWNNDVRQDVRELKKEISAINMRLKKMK